MRKHTNRILAICLAVGTLLALSLTVSAETVKGSAVFNGSAVTVNLSSSQISSKLSSLTPGDEITIAFDVINNSGKTTDWYVLDKTVKSFEDGVSATNGAYDFELAYTDPSGKKTVIKSSQVGGESSSGPVGLHQATSGTENYYFLDTLKKNQKGLFTIYVAIDGETLNNDYQSTLADIRVNFAVETADGSSANSKSSGHKVLTGDQLRLIVYLILLAACAAALTGIIIYRRKSGREES